MGTSIAVGRIVPRAGSVLYPVSFRIIFTLGNPTNGGGPGGVSLNGQMDLFGEVTSADE